MNTEFQYLEEFESKNFLLIQNELIKILSKTPNIYIEQSHLYEKLIKTSLNNSLNMKYMFIMVLRILPIMSENILIKKENNIFSGIFLDKKDGLVNPISFPKLKKDFIDLELPETKFISEQDLSVFNGVFCKLKTLSTSHQEQALLGADETDDENSHSSGPKRACSDADPMDLPKVVGTTKEWMIPSVDKKNIKDPSFPTETQVIQFIVDNDIKSFLFRKDYQGNTILHSLIIDCDAPRIENLLKTCFYSFIEKNNAGKTPLDLITDIKVSNIVHTILYQDLEYYSYKVTNLEMFVEKIDILFKYTVFSIILIDIALLILVKYY
jgi:hypothetical protein